MKKEAENNDAGWSQVGDFTIDHFKMQYKIIPTILISLLFSGIPYLFLYGFRSIMNGFYQFFQIEVLLIVFIFGIVSHELLHGIGWLISGGVSFRNLHFGVDWKSLTPYAHCDKALPVNAYRLGSLLPGVALGIIPWFISLLTKDVFLWYLGTFFILSAAGDFYMMWLIRKIKPPLKVKDHPRKIGCLVYKSENDA